MRLQIETLVRELEELAVLNRELAEACKDKLAAMRSADTGAIEAAGRRERELVEAIQRHEKGRREICEGLAGKLGLAPQTICRVSQLAAWLPEPHASRVLSLAASMKRSMTEIRRVNRVNQVVAEQVQHYFGDALAAMSRPAANSRTYGRSGRFAAPAGAPLFSATA